MASDEKQAPPERVIRNGIRRFLPMADSLFDEPAYRNYFFAFFFYFSSMQMTVLARPWIAYELSGRDGLSVGITMAVNYVPSLLLSPYAGALADRMSKRTILQVTALAMAAFAGLTAYGLIDGWLTWWHVAIIGAGQGTVMTFITPTRRAIVPDLVRPTYVLNATALHTVELNINRAFMILIAGFIIEGAGAEYAFLTILGMYVFTAVALFTVPLFGAHASERRRKKGGGSAMDGIRYAAKDVTIRRLLLIGIIGAVFGQPIQQMTVLFDGVLGVDAAGIGGLLTAMGIGAFGGSLAASSLGDYRRKGLLLIAFFTLLGVAIVAFSFSTSYILSFALMLVVGFGHSGRTSVHLATLQTYSPPDMRGRVMALNAMQSGLQPISILVVGALAEWWSVQGTFALLGAVILVYGIWELVFSRTVRDLE